MKAGLSALAPLLASAALAACDGDASSPPFFADGLVAEFAVLTDTFSVLLTRPEAIQDVLEIARGVNPGRFPSGPVRRGPGTAAHNAPWSWHLDPAETELIEAAIELCDGRPSMVEADVERWIESVGRFCPWSAELVAVRELR